MKIFKTIDQTVLNVVSKWESSPEITKVNDALYNLDDQSQKVIKIFVFVLICFLPLTLLLILFLFNSSVKKDIELRESIINTANEIIAKNSSLGSKSKELLGPSFVNEFSQFKQLVTSSFSIAGADLSKLQVSDFETSDLSGNITQAQAIVKFSGLSTAQVFMGLSYLSTKNKMRFEDILISKNESTNLLTGELKVLYFGREVLSDE